MPRHLLTFTGPRGAGKDTALGKVLEEYPRIHRIVPCTTRSPRIGEVNGIHQYFISEQVFAEKERNGEFVFVNPMNDSGYRSGTLKSELLHDICAVDITAYGANIMRDYVLLNGGSVLSFFIYAGYRTRYKRIRKRQPDKTPLEVKQMMIGDPTIPNP